MINYSLNVRTVALFVSYIWSIGCGEGNNETQLSSREACIQEQQGQWITPKSCVLGNVVLKTPFCCGELGELCSQPNLGYNMDKFIVSYGILFVIVTFISSIHAILNKRSQKQLIFYSYAAVFWLAFAKGSARTYFYVPMVPFIIGIIANLFHDIASKLKEEKIQIGVIIVLSAIILFSPINKLAEEQSQKNLKPEYANLHTAYSAQKWIEKNIKKNTKIIYYGYYTNLPKLIDPDEQEQMNYGEHFMYNRINNEFLKSTFKYSHKKYIEEEKPTYQLMSFLGFKYQGRDVRWNLRYGIRKEEFPLFLNVLPQTGAEYIVASTYPRKHKSMNLMDVPELNKKIVAQFSNKDYPYGKEVTIYKIK